MFYLSDKIDDRDNNSINHRKESTMIINILALLVSIVSVIVSITSGIISHKANKKSAAMSEKLQKIEMRQNIIPYFNLDFGYKDQSETNITDNGFNLNLVNVGNMTAVNMTLSRKEKEGEKNNVPVSIFKEGNTKNKFAFPKDKVEMHLTKGELANKMNEIKIDFTDVMGRRYSQNIYLIRRRDWKISEIRSYVDDPVLEED